MHASFSSLAAGKTLAVTTDSHGQLTELRT